MDFRVSLSLPDTVFWKPHPDILNFMSWPLTSFLFSLLLVIFIFSEFFAFCGG